MKIEEQVINKFKKQGYKFPHAIWNKNNKAVIAFVNKQGHYKFAMYIFNKKNTVIKAIIYQPIETLNSFIK